MLTEAEYRYACGKHDERDKWKNKINELIEKCEKEKAETNNSMVYEMMTYYISAYKELLEEMEK